MSFQVLSSLPFAQFVNDKIDFTQRESLAYQYGQMVQSYGGDPLAGQLTGNTKIPWNKTTEVQSLIFEYYATQCEAASPQNPGLPSNLEQILRENAGPNELWNYSYEQWGLVPNVPGAIHILETAEVNTGRAVRVIQP